MEDYEWDRPKQKVLPVFVGWPEHEETLIVMARSQRAVNAPETVTTRCFNLKGEEVLVFHKDEELRPKDAVIIDPDGQVRIKRTMQLEVANQ